MNSVLNPETDRARPKKPLPGALVLSLDFELHWGYCDHRELDEKLKHELLAARRAVEEMLELFRRRGVHASWATVGFLMFGDRDSLMRVAPEADLRPGYLNGRLDPYRVQTGADEQEDPYHFAAGLVEKIRTTAGQELASHTFSHYYCLESGQTGEAFAADLAAAQKAAGAAKGDTQPLRSIVFPRNQHNPAYADILLDYGILAYRGNPRHPLYRPLEQKRDRALWRRAGRLIDTYVNISGHHLQGWDELMDLPGPIDVRASRFLRPWSGKLAALEGLKVRRIRNSIREAARKGSVFHLWWHPHNFARNMDKNLANLELILDEFGSCREQYGMNSLNIGEIADILAECSRNGTRRYDQA